MGTPRNSPCNSCTVPTAPTRITRNRSAPQCRQCQSTADEPHQLHRGASAAGTRTNGPLQRRHRASCRHCAQLNDSVTPSCGMENSTGPCSSAFDSTRTAVCGTLAPTLGSASRLSSSRFSHRTGGAWLLITSEKPCTATLGPATSNTTEEVWLSHSLNTLRALPIATKTPPWSLARRRHTPRAFA